MGNALQVLLNATIYAMAAAVVVWGPLMLTSPGADTLTAELFIAREVTAEPEAVADDPPRVADIFGRPERAAPVPGDPPPANAPERTLPYAIKGLVLSGERSWAILGGLGKDAVISVGDVLEDGAYVAKIDAQGVHLVIDETTYLIAREDATRTITRSAAAVPLPDDPEEEIVFRIGRLEAAEVQRLLARGGRLGPRSEVAGGIPVLWARSGEFLDRLGLDVGDVIVSVDDVPVPALTDEVIARRAVQNDGRVVFEVRTGDERRRIPVRFATT